MARRRLRAQAESEVPGVTSLQALAVGGNSTVYRAWQPELDRWVAVKVLGVTLSDARARDRFLRECSAVGRLTGHPAMVTVLASGVTRTDRPFLIMDLFERGSLADLIATSGSVQVEVRVVQHQVGGPPKGQLLVLDQPVLVAHEAHHQRRPRHRSSVPSRRSGRGRQGGR